jgi:hypothetical protein
MPEIGDRASAPEVEIVLAPEMAGAYRMQDASLTAAEQIGDPDGFPDHGLFLPVYTVRVEGSASNQPSLVDGEEQLLEIPLMLEQELDRLGIESGETFAVSQPRKAEGGRWIMDVRGPVGAEDLL